ncbi:MAG: helix-turn-helix domain-containing protein [Candidatus Dormibacteria bacterium]
MTLLLDRQQTSSSVALVQPRERVASGLLAESVFGTNAGVVMRSLQGDVFGITTVAARGAHPAAVGVADEVRSLRDAICAAGVSRQALARLLGVDRRSLSGWVRGEIRPGPERLARLRALACIVGDIDDEYPGRVNDVLATPRGTLTLLEAVAEGRTRADLWRAWMARAASTVTVTTRRRDEEPIWAAAARAIAEGRIAVPAWERTVRPDTTYEMRPDEEAAAFVEPEHESRRRGYR